MLLFSPFDFSRFLYFPIRSTLPCIYTSHTPSSPPPPSTPSRAQPVRFARSSPKPMLLLPFPSFPSLRALSTRRVDSRRERRCAKLRLGSARLLTVLYADILIANPLIPHRGLAAARRTGGGKSFIGAAPDPQKHRNFGISILEIDFAGKTK